MNKLAEELCKRLYYKVRFGINFRKGEKKTMITTVVKFSGSTGDSLIGMVDSADVKEFQKLQKHIMQSLTKLGDDGAAGLLLKPPDSVKLDTQAVAVLSMEAIGTGDQAGFYSKTTQESRFDRMGTYTAFVDFCNSLLSDILAKAGVHGKGHGKK